MTAVTELLAQYYPQGSETYYRTLFLKQQKQNTQLLILLHDVISSILYSSNDANVRQQKIQWWAEECQNALFSSTPYPNRQAKHPITQALDHSVIDGDAFQAFIAGLTTLATQQQATSAFSGDYAYWLINALDNTINKKTSQLSSNVIFDFMALKNLPLILAGHYKVNDRMPKYLNTSHLKGKNQQVIIDYLNNEITLLQSKLRQLKGIRLPAVVITQLLLIDKVLKKIKNQPQSIYNIKENLPPLTMLFTSYFSKNKQVF